MFYSFSDLERLGTSMVDVLLVLVFAADLFLDFQLSSPVPANH
jgi:hypothetical protein